MISVKKISLLFFVLSLGLLQDCFAGKDKKRQSSEIALSTEQISQTIKDLANTYFTAEKLDSAQRAGSITTETRSFIEKTQSHLKTTITNADERFSKIPGYPELKEKILGYMNLFCVCLGHNQEQIKALEKKLLQDFTVLSTGATPTEVKAIDPLLAAQLSEKQRKLIQPKKDYLESLLELEELQPAGIESHEKPEWGLTRKDRCVEKLKFLSKMITEVPAKAADKKKSYKDTFKKLVTLDRETATNFEIPEWKLFVASYGQLQAERQSFDSYAIGLRGSIYELKAALKAAEHKKTIVAFGVTVTITFDEKKSKHRKVIEEIEHENFLREVRTKKNSEHTLSQEFDLVTDGHIIECKCINQGIQKYITNLQREQWIANHAEGATSITITAGEEKRPELREYVTGKPVVCYVEYAQGATSYNRDRAQEEVRLLEEGFTLWNGFLYCHQLEQNYFEQPDAENKLKILIQNIGERNIVLHCIILSTEEKKQKEEIFSRWHIQKKEATASQTDTAHQPALLAKRPHTPTPPAAEANIYLSPSRAASSVIPAGSPGFSPATELARQVKQKQESPAQKTPMRPESAEPRMFTVRSIIFNGITPNNDTPISPLTEAMKGLDVKHQKDQQIENAQKAHPCKRARKLFDWQGSASCIDRPAPGQPEGGTQSEASLDGENGAAEKALPTGTDAAAMDVAIDAHQAAGAQSASQSEQARSPQPPPILGGARRRILQAPTIPTNLGMTIASTQPTPMDATNAPQQPTLKRKTTEKGKEKAHDQEEPDSDDDDQNEDKL